MSLALHGHHALIVAMLVFVTAVLTPNWYNSPDQSIRLQPLEICSNSTLTHRCHWIFYLLDHQELVRPLQMLYPILTASFTLGCVANSLLSLFLGSWYLQRRTPEKKSLWLLALTMLVTFAALLLSCAVCVLLLTTNLQQELFEAYRIRLADFGFSFWTGVGSAVTYFYAFIIYLIAVCKG